MNLGLKPEPLEELLESKHPMAWAEFEKGLVDEVHILEA